MVNYSTFIYLLNLGCVEKKGKKFQKFKYENKKSSLDEIKKHFSQILKGYYFVEKQKIADTNLKVSF